LQIVDLETGEELGTNQDGELVLYGPHIMKGYHNNQEDTDHCIKDGWLYTGKYIIFFGNSRSYGRNALVL
jgi:long-chain acyl-CoA synthetase